MSLRKAIVTAAEGPHAPMLDLALPTFQNYAERFGYDVVVGAGEEAAQAGRPGPWRKVPLIRNALNEYHVVLWLDTDVMILDASRDIAEELAPDDYQGLVEQVSSDGRIPNTGVWVLRAGDRAQRFLEAIWNEIDFIDHMWTDQAAAVTALGYDLAPWLPDASLARPCERRRDTPLFRGTRLLSAEWNSLSFWMPVERPRFNHHAGAWPLERRVKAMREDARGLPYHPLSVDGRGGASAAAADPETEARYASIERELGAALSPGDDFVVADQEEWRPTSRLADRGLPFPHRNGAFTGCPADDRAAIEEVERERERGTRVIAFVWPMLWWLSSYPDLRRHLRHRFRCIAESGSLVAFDLQDARNAEGVEALRPFDGMEDPDSDDPALPPPTGRLGEVLAELALARPEYVVQFGLEDWNLSVAIAFIWPYTGLWGFGGDFEMRERCRRLAYANGAPAERVTLQHRCEVSWLAAMADSQPVILSTLPAPFDLLNPTAVAGLAVCTLLMKVDESQVQSAGQRFDTHDLELLTDESSAQPGQRWVLLRPASISAVDEAYAKDHLRRLADEVAEVRFLHIGAHDGVSDERLEPFIRQRGWRGIFVEPLPALRQALEENYRDVDGLRFENSAIADTDGDRLFFEVAPRPGMPPWASQLSSLRKDVILAHAQAVPGLEECIIERRVPCLSVDTLLEKYNVGGIHVLVVDTEGYDYEILRQVDFARLQPRIVIYEEKHLPLRDKHTARQLLKSAGYNVRAAVGNDCFAVREAAGGGSRPPS